MHQGITRYSISSLHHMGYTGLSKCIWCVSVRECVCIRGGCALARACVCLCARLGVCLWGCVRSFYARVCVYVRACLCSCVSTYVWGCMRLCVSVRECVCMTRSMHDSGRTCFDTSQLNVTPICLLFTNDQWYLRNRLKAIPCWMQYR